VNSDRNEKRTIVLKTFDSNSKEFEQLQLRQGMGMFNDEM